MLHWIGRRWVEFGRGYTGYLAFMVNFATFITVLYSLNDFIQEQFRFQTFVMGVIAIIIPLAVFIGHVHFAKQYRNEMEIGIKKNPYTYRIVPRSKEVVQVKAMIEILKKTNGDPEVIKQLQNLMIGKDTRDE